MNQASRADSDSKKGPGSRLTTGIVEKLPFPLVMSGIRKAYSILGALLLVELGLQFYFIATAALNVWGAPDNAGAVYSAFKTSDPWASLHAINGTIVIPITALVMLVLAFVAG